MGRGRWLMAVALLAAAAGGAAAWGQRTATVPVLQVRGVVTPPVAAAIDTAVRTAVAAGAPAVVLDLDSEGTLGVGAALATPLRTAAVPVVAYIAPGGRAAGGAGLLAVAADVLVVGPGSTVGPLLPFDLAAGDPGSADPATDGLDNYTVLRRLLPAGAASQLTAADLAVRTWSAEEALRRGLAVATADDPAAAARAAAAVPGSGVVFRDGTEVRTVAVGATGVQRLLAASAAPTTAYVLLVLVVAGVAALAWRPGTVGPFVGLATPFALYGLVVVPFRWWAVVLVVVAVALVAFDAGVVWFGVPTGVAVAALLLAPIGVAGGPALRVSPGAGVGVAVGAALVSVTGRARQARADLVTGAPGPAG